jgi:adenylate kinase family enzyme
MHRNNRFIILRGPSGAGKSTVAKRLFDSSTCRTAFIQQDHYRFIFKPAGGGSKTNASTIHRMIEHNCIAALKDGYDVILEGILTVQSYAALLDEVIMAHSGPSYMFYLDVSFEETVKRHKTREHLTNFTAKDMRSWYDASHSSNHHLEQIIPESFSVEEALLFIKNSIQQSPAPDADFAALHQHR